MILRRHFLMTLGSVIVMGPSCLLANRPSIYALGSISPHVDETEMLEVQRMLQCVERPTKTIFRIISGEQVPLWCTRVSQEGGQNKT